MSRYGSRLRAACGIAGPALFTAAWATSTLRQEHPARKVHISGLAAPDARTPHLMTAGFFALGACTMAFSKALEEALGGPDRAGDGPLFVRLAGLATIVAGLLRRDYMLNERPEGDEHQSWRNDGHDIASGVIYVCVVAGPLLLAQRFGQEPRWRPIRRGAIASALGAGALLILFASRAVEPWNGIVQRVAVTLPMAGMANMAARMLWRTKS